MNSRRSVLKTLAVAMLCSAASPILAQTRRTDTIRALDTDSDGTIDLAEAKKAASAVFAKLDRDHDDTLSRRELLGRLSERECGRSRPRRHADDGGISRPGRTALQCRQSGQGRNFGREGAGYQGRAGVAPLDQIDVRASRTLKKTKAQRFESDYLPYDATDSTFKRRQRAPNSWRVE
jgi:hypothetical protein